MPSPSTRECLLIPSRPAPSFLKECATCNSEANACAICLESCAISLEQPILICGHCRRALHVSCAMKLRSTRCPTCRSKIFDKPPCTSSSSSATPGIEADDDSEVEISGVKCFAVFIASLIAITSFMTCIYYIMQDDFGPGMYLGAAVFCACFAIPPFLPL